MMRNFIFERKSHINLKLNYKFTMLLLVLTIASCNLNTKKTQQSLFKKESWQKKNSSIQNDADPYDWFLRESMLNDLTENHLKLGMSKDTILSILGSPSEFPINCSDSYKPINIVSLNRDEWKKHISESDIEILLNSEKTERMLLYTCGFSGSGPNLFVIIFNQNQAVDFLKVPCL
jgi:hypothetical protein